MSDVPSRPRAPGHHEALSRDARERPRRLRPPARGGPRAARRERRRQVDPHEHPLRALQPGRGRDPDQRRAVQISSPGDAIDRGIGMVHQHFMLIPVMSVAENIVLAIEPRRDGILLDYGAARTRVAELRRVFGFAIDPDALVQDITRRPAATRRDPQGVVSPAPTSSSSTSRPRCSRRRRRWSCSGS